MPKKRRQRFRRFKTGLPPISEAATRYQLVAEWLDDISGEPANSHRLTLRVISNSVLPYYVYKGTDFPRIVSGKGRVIPQTSLFPFPNRHDVVQAAMRVMSYSKYPPVIRSDGSVEITIEEPAAWRSMSFIDPAVSRLAPERLRLYGEEAGQFFPVAPGVLDQGSKE